MIASLTVGQVSDMGMDLDNFTVLHTNCGEMERRRDYLQDSGDEVRWKYTCAGCGGVTVLGLQSVAELSRLAIQQTGSTIIHDEISRNPITVLPIAST